jgi:hypothetical protein
MKTKLYLALVAALCLALILFSPALAKKSYQAERFDVTIAVQPDGTLNVTETIVFRFTGGPFTYVFRELVFNDLDEIDNLQASLDGQALAQRTTMGIPFGLGAAALTTLLGVVGVIVAGRSFRRETAIFQNNVYQSLSAPPRAIPPALAAKLTGSGVPFLGTLFDLARRGVLRIEEGPKKWGSRTFEVIRQPTSERLQPHEQVFLDALFHKARNERVALSEIASLAYNGQFSQALDHELTTAGWRDAERSSRRGRFLVASVLGLLLGLAAMGVGFLIVSFLSETQPAALIVGAILLGVGVAACGVGILGLMVAALISTLSDEGAQQVSAWNSFAGYLRNITRGREPEASPDLFGRYLPYAAGMGLATEWAIFFQKQANVPIPEWLMSLQSGMEDSSFVAILAAISAADSSVSAATGGDGGGASGGGSSGAG